MITEPCILRSAGATTEHYDVHESIFLENQIPEFYYQIVEGKVKLTNYSADRKEALHNILGSGQSLGESALFLQTYSVNAITLSPCTVLKLPKPAFMELLVTDPEFSREINRRISSYLHFKHIMGQIIYNYNPTKKLQTLLDYLKSINREKERFTLQIPFTRQEIANLTGLCVETTIRTVKKMERNKLLKIKNRHIIY